MPNSTEANHRFIKNLESILISVKYKANNFKETNECLILENMIGDILTKRC